MTTTTNYKILKMDRFDPGFEEEMYAMSSKMIREVHKFLVRKEHLTETEQIIFEYTQYMLFEKWYNDYDEAKNYYHSDWEFAEDEYGEDDDEDDDFVFEIEEDDF